MCLILAAKEKEKTKEKKFKELVRVKPKKKKKKKKKTKPGIFHGGLPHLGKTRRSFVGLWAQPSMGPGRGCGLRLNVQPTLTES